MADPTLEELLTIPTQQTILDTEVLSYLQSQELRVDDWTSNAVYRAFAFIVSFMRLDVRKIVAVLCAAGFEDYVFGLVDSPVPGLDVTLWCELVARNRYGLERIPASHTRRRITLTNSIAIAYPGITAGGITVLFPSGNRYILDEDIDIPIGPGGEVVAVFRSEFATDSSADLVYNDPSDSEIVIVQSDFAGVTATNPAEDFTEVSQSGSGVGIVEPSGTPTGNHSFVVRIDTTGNAADIAWSISLDGGAFEAQSGASVVDVGGTGVTITLDDDTGDPAFSAGTFYFFNTPGSDVTEPGRDQETPQELGLRCRNLWPLLALIKDSAGNFVPVSPTQSGYELLALSASSQVVVAYVQTGSVNNEILICVAGQGVLLPPAALAAVQDYFRSRNRLTDYVVIVSPILREIEIADLVITVRAGMLATAQAAVQRALQIYFAGLDGGSKLKPNGRIDHAYVASLIRRATGVEKVNDTVFTIEGTAGDYQMPAVAGTIELAQWQQTAAIDFTWVEE